MNIAQDFADTIKYGPNEIIAWCRSEIKEYEKLIKIIEKKSDAEAPAKDTKEKLEKT